MTATVGPQPGSYARHSASRHPDRRRRTLEKLLAGLVLLVAFAITMALLGLQWLGNQSNSSAAGVTGNAIVSQVGRT